MLLSHIFMNSCFIPMLVNVSLNIMQKLLFLVLFLIPTLEVSAQSAKYLDRKKDKLSKPSPFEALINDNSKRELVYEDDLVVAFEPLRKQAPIHLLIVPKERIPTVNDLAPDHSNMIAQLLFAAKELAKDFGIAESGYRLAINTNEDAGQSVFHIHVHLLGGMKLGPMMDQIYSKRKVKD